MKRLALLLLLLPLPALAEKPVSSRFSILPEIASDGNKFAVVYVSYQKGVTFRTFDTRATNLGPESSIGWAFSGPADLISANGVWPLAFSVGGAPSNVYFAAFDDAGNLAIPVTQLSQDASYFGAYGPVLVWTGSVYEVVWEDIPSDNKSVEIDFASLDGAGNILVPQKQLVPPIVYPHDMAFDAKTGVTGLCWWENVYRTSHSGVLLPSGDFAAPPADITPVLGGVMGIAGNGNGFGALIGAFPRNYFMPLGTDMKPTGPQVLIIDNLDSTWYGPLLFTGSAYFVTFLDWNDPWYFYFYRFNSFGGLRGGLQHVSDDHPVYVSGAPGTRSAMGRNAVGVVWEDDRNNLGEVFFQPIPMIEVMVGEGAGPANPAWVRSRNPFRGEEVMSLLPYSSNGYGVDVGAGRIDSSPLDSLLTGPGPGPAYGPQVKGFTGGEMLLGKVNFYAYGTLRTGVHVEGAELDADGMAEILTGAGPGEVFGPHVRGFDYDGVKVRPVGGVNFYAYNTLKYGVEVAGGDIDGDAFAEIATGPGPSPQFGPDLRTFDYDGGGIQGKAELWPFSGRHGLLVGSGDLSGSGKAEVTASPGPDPGQPSDVKIYRFQGGLNLLAKITPFPGLYGGAHQGTGDVELDSDEELCVTPGFLPANPGLLKVYHRGISGFTSLPKLDQPVFPGHGYGATCAIGNVGI